MNIIYIIFNDFLNINLSKYSSHFGSIIINNIYLHHHLFHLIAFLLH